MTADQIKAKFRNEGRTFSAFARAHNLRLNDVYKVINGQHKGHRGKAHDIAVLLGMKSDPGATA